MFDFRNSSQFYISSPTLLVYQQEDNNKPLYESICKQYQKRGKDFWSEFELYLADLLAGVVVDVALAGFSKLPPFLLPEALYAHIEYILMVNCSSYAAFLKLRGWDGVLYGSMGFGCGLIGQGIANMVMTAKPFE
ncbi:hypothetical protein Q3G72_005291 [Acer saccharum]|nr:hypothetical protein Q3G72_005291 [Acer saccharum]